jgi:hypothetical protein
MGVGSQYAPSLCEAVASNGTSFHPLAVGNVVPLADFSDQRERVRGFRDRQRDVASSMPSASSWKDFSNRRRTERSEREPIACRGVAARRRQISFVKSGLGEKSKG